MGWGKKNKYGAKRVQDEEGRSFASQGERALYRHLKELELAGELEELCCQVSVHLSAARILYKPDFRARCGSTGDLIWYEYKGFETPVWRIKRRLWMHYGPGVLKVFKGRVGRIFESESIVPKGGLK